MMTGASPRSANSLEKRTPLCGSLLSDSGVGDRRTAPVAFGTTGAREGVPRGFSCFTILTRGLLPSAVSVDLAWKV